MAGTDYSAHVTNPVALGSAPAAAAAVATAPADEGGFTFDDFLDIINPLQHIPVISTLYRHFTGDKIGVPERVAGDTLYGGVIGFVASLGNVLFQEVTGRDVGDTVLALVTGDDDTATAVAAAPAATPASVTPASSVSTPDVAALASALAGKGVAAETAQRAIFAYGRAVARSEQQY